VSGAINALDLGGDVLKRFAGAELPVLQATLEVAILEHFLLGTGGKRE
jgi:hypothetical protein